MLLLGFQQCWQIREQKLHVCLVSVLRMLMFEDKTTTRFYDSLPRLCVFDNFRLIKLVKFGSIDLIQYQLKCSRHDSCFSPCNPFNHQNFMSLSVNYINKTLGNMKKTFGAHHIVDLKVLCLLLSKVSVDDKKNNIFEPTVLKLLRYQFFQVMNLNL